MYTCILLYVKVIREFICISVKDAFFVDGDYNIIICHISGTNAYVSMYREKCMPSA